MYNDKQYESHKVTLETWELIGANLSKIVKVLECRHLNSYTRINHYGNLVYIIHCMYDGNLT